MKRVLGLTAVLCVLGASPALAAGGPGPVKYDFSAKAAGLDQIGRDQVKFVVAAPKGSAQKKSFWKSPWPYVIGGALLVVVVVARGKDGSGY